MMVVLMVVVGIDSATAANIISVVVEAEEPVGEGRVGGVRPLVVAMAMVVGHGHGHPVAAVLAARPHEGRRHLHSRFLAFVTCDLFFFPSELSSRP